MQQIFKTIIKQPSMHNAQEISGFAAISKNFVSTFGNDGFLLTHTSISCPHQSLNWQRKKNFMTVPILRVIDALSKYLLMGKRVCLGAFGALCLSTGGDRMKPASVCTQIFSPRRAVFSWRKFTCAWRKFTCAKRKFIYAKRKFIYAKSKFICTKSKFIYAKSKFIYAKSKFICTKSKFIYAKSKFIYAKSKFIYAKSKFCSARVQMPLSTTRHIPAFAAV
ncbi:MAG: hypothetical protein LBS09_04900, partial [Bacteroidales bacterium]|nr:hypothetical protein [Bacteroidales bacterium]